MTFWTAFFAGSAVVSFVWTISLVRQRERMRSNATKAAGLIMLQHKMLLQAGAAEDDETTAMLLEGVVQLLEGDVNRVAQLKQKFVELGMVADDKEDEQ